jgi:hypothetical protein
MDSRNVRGAQLFCAWSGPAFVVIFLICWIPVARLAMPATSAAASPAEISEFFAVNRIRILIACLGMAVGMPMIGFWGGLIAARTKQVERGFPMFTYAQVGCLGASICIIELIPMLWALAAFRAGEVDPAVTGAFNDAAWFMLLYTWPPFTAWIVAMVIPSLALPDGATILPRWTAYFGLWCGVLFFPAGLIGFFKHGPFAYDGLLAMYIPLGIFAAWVMVTSIVLHIQIRQAQPRVSRVAATSGVETA